MKNIRMALNCMSPGDFMVSIDLKDTYFSVPFCQSHRKYLLSDFIMRAFTPATVIRNGGFTEGFSW